MSRRGSKISKEAKEVSFRRSGYCLRIQSPPRTFYKFGRIKRISSLFGEFANSIQPAESSQNFCPPVSCVFGSD
jgi:hypothetical protein